MPAPRGERPRRGAPGPGAPRGRRPPLRVLGQARTACLQDQQPPRLERWQRCHVKLSCAQLPRW